MTKDAYAKWLNAARRADALRAEVGDMLRAGEQPSKDLLVRLAELEEDVLAMQGRVVDIVPPMG